MASKERVKAERLYNTQYKRSLSVPSGVCFYCGEAACEEDHVPPISLITALGSGNKLNLRYLLIPSCRECNNTLSAKSLLTVKTRAQYLLGRTVLEYSDMLILPEWGEELEDLNGRMREYVQLSETHRRVLERRLTFLENMPDRLHLIDDVPIYVPPPVDLHRSEKEAALEARRVAIAHVTACRSEHLRSVIGKGVGGKRDSREAILDAYEAELEEKLASSRVISKREYVGDSVDENGQVVAISKNRYKHYSGA